MKELACFGLGVVVAFGFYSFVAFSSKTINNGKSLFKLAVFVPETHSQIVREKLWEANAGKIGLYDSCAFESFGVGYFRPLEKANPFLGQANQLETVKEVKLEVVVEEMNLKSVMKALREAHPYEEIAFDLIELYDFKLPPKIK